MKHFVSAVFLFAVCSSFAFAGQIYTVDRSHSQATFFIRHYVETVEGTFNDVSGTITYDPSDITRSKVHVAIKISSVDTHASQRDKHLQTADFFDARSYPAMIFDSQRVEKRPSGLVAIGSFTMRGTTKSIEIPFTLSLNAKGDQPNGNMTIHGTTAVNRRDYNVGSEEFEDNRLTLGNEVKIELNLQATAQ
jgi:polyisoprenoid-binding protein YceI